MSDTEKERKIIYDNLKGDLKILWVALRRLACDLFALIKTVKFSFGFLRLDNIKSNWLWVALPLSLVLIIYLVLKCSGGDYMAVTVDVEKPYSFGYKPSVQAPEVAHRVSNIDFRRNFNDMNDTHLAVAKKIGIAPLASREDVPNSKRALIETNDTDAYMVDKLTHSIPFLVPEAAELLSRIGKNFQDSLVMKHLAPHKVIVTSVLRTNADVKRLKRSNVNSSSNSAHCYGTTFDISWKRFLSEYGETTENSVKLKLILSEVLRDLKKQGSCYIKHEAKQACFHITARDFPKK